MLLFVIIAMFVAGLMVGRTPEYLGKKLEAKEVKMAMLAILILPRPSLASPHSRCCRPAPARWRTRGHTATRGAVCLHLRHRQQRQRLRRYSANVPFWNDTLGPSRCSSAAS
jgi:hypothetical protein